MPTSARKSSSPKAKAAKLVLNPQTGELREVRGFGALKGGLKIRAGVDLTKPIYEQVASRRSGKAAAHRP